jgi:hypothetical protein
MRTRYRVDGRIVHFEVNDGSESVIIELSRASLRGNSGLIIRDTRARAIAAGSAGSGRSSSSSRATTGPAGAGEAEATAVAGRRYGCKLSE